MHDLELGRLIQADREREIARDQRVRAFRAAQAGDSDLGFVPPMWDRPDRITNVLRLLPDARRGA